MRRYFLNMLRKSLASLKKNILFWEFLLLISARLMKNFLKVDISTNKELKTLTESILFYAKYSNIYIKKRNSRTNWLLHYPRLVIFLCLFASLFIYLFYVFHILHSKWDAISKAWIIFICLHPCNFFLWKFVNYIYSTAK